MTSLRLTDESSTNPAPPLPPPNRQSNSRYRHETDSGRQPSDVSVYRTVATSDVPNGTLRKKWFTGPTAPSNSSFGNRTASPPIGSVPTTQCCTCCCHGSRVPSIQISERCEPSPRATGAPKWRQQIYRKTFCSNDSSKNGRSVRHVGTSYVVS